MLTIQEMRDKIIPDGGKDFTGGQIEKLRDDMEAFSSLAFYNQLHIHCVRLTKI